MKILAFGASSSKQSINKQFATYAATFFDHTDLEILDLNDFEMPVFSVDKEKDSDYSKEAQAFVNKIGDADFLIISMAEHNGSYTAAFKNIFDWASRIESKTFQHKPMLLLSTSPGARAGKSVMDAAQTRFPFHAAQIIGTFSLPEFGKNFNKEIGITNEELKNQFLITIEDVKNKLEEISDAVENK